VTLPDSSLNPCDHLVTRPVTENVTEIWEKIARSKGVSFVTFGVCEESADGFAKLGLPLYSTGEKMVLNLTDRKTARWRSVESHGQRSSMGYPFGFSLAYWVSWSAVMHLVFFRTAKATGIAS
jgi:hypothetical protein